MKAETCSEKVLGVIPARWGASRFPGKSLHPIAGKPLVQHVWERCCQCELLHKVVIATDDERIEKAAKDFGAEVSMTSPDHPSGTDRIAETAEQEPNYNILINIQGDEPMISPQLVDTLAEKLLADSRLPMITAANPLEEEALHEDPNIVKVVLTKDYEALYFSRSLIPFPRNKAALPVYRHQGIYGYRRDFLLQFVKWDPSPLEKTEQLEQLRALENGARIAVVLVEDDSVGVDTPEQAEQVTRLMSKQ